MTIIESILSIIYPPVCGVCGKLNNKFLCSKCEKSLRDKAIWKIQKMQNKNFQEHLYLFKYEGIIRKTILDYKFNEKSYIYKTFANFLLSNKKFFSIIKSYDTIIPVPVSRKRKMQRGYNQCELIAKEIAKKADIDLNTNCLIKTKNIIAQSKLNKKQREENIQGAYVLKNKKQIENKKILILDDIYTTGSTVEECSKILKQANPEKITVITIAKD